MKLLSWNVNGLRAVHGKGFLKWFKREAAEIVCLQEIKAREEQLDPELRDVRGYRAYFHPAEKPGYSGVAIYTSLEPRKVEYGIGDPSIDSEGRVLQADFGDFTLINAYFPNSQREHTRLDYKLYFCRAMLQHCKKLRSAGKNLVLCGDFNVAHREIDLANPKSNEDNAGFLPQERAWMSEFLSQGFTDVFREMEPDRGHYTWWSYRPGVRERNIGWRIDYHVVNEEFRGAVLDSYHQPKVTGSDHCPVGLTLKV